MTLWDPGAQPERTTLAWSRTTLALIAAGLLCVRLATTPLQATLAALAVCGAATLQFHRTRHQHHHRVRTLPTNTRVANPTSILLTTAATLTLATTGIVLGLG
ncbi:DUF202 domain-containing protein [Actinomadura flavalba]|uniref:DUF202 domain-containing protein n=1 Tax=Actinomadura flavalba TaxID=1120938 RepID=UPI000368963C|nr:DUF202 domain-containing protein [Actinomadura flavalba]